MGTAIFAIAFALAGENERLLIAGFLVALMLVIWWAIRQPLKTGGE